MTYNKTLNSGDAKSCPNLGQICSFGEWRVSGGPIGFRIRWWYLRLLGSILPARGIKSPAMILFFWPSPPTES